MSILEKIEDKTIDLLLKSTGNTPEGYEQSQENEYQRIMSDPVLRKGVAAELCDYYNRFVESRIEMARMFRGCDAKAAEYVNSSVLYGGYNREDHNFNCDLSPEDVRADILKALKIRFSVMSVVEQNIYATLYYLNLHYSRFKTGEYTDGHIMKRTHSLSFGKLIERDPDFIFDEVVGTICESALYKDGEFDCSSYYKKEFVTFFFNKVIKYHNDLDTEGINKEKWDARRQEYAKESKDNWMSLHGCDDPIEAVATGFTSGPSPIYSLYLNIPWMMCNMDALGLLSDNTFKAEDLLLASADVSHLDDLNDFLLDAVKTFGDPLGRATEDYLEVFGPSVRETVLYNTQTDPLIDKFSVIYEPRHYCLAVDIIEHYLWQFDKGRYSGDRLPYNLLFSPLAMHRTTERSACNAIKLSG